MPNPFQLKSSTLTQKQPSGQSKGVKSNWDILAKSAVAVELVKPAESAGELESRTVTDENAPQSRHGEDGNVNAGHLNEKRGNLLLELCSSKPMPTGRQTTGTNQFTSIANALNEVVAPAPAVKRPCDHTVDNDGKTRKSDNREPVNLLTKKIKTDSTSAAKDKVSLMCDELPDGIFGLGLYSSITFLSTSKPSLNLKLSNDDKALSFYHFNPDNVRPALSPYYKEAIVKQDDSDTAGLEWKQALISLYQLWKSHRNECEWFYYFHADEFVCVFNRSVDGEGVHEYAAINVSTLALCKCLIEHGFVLENDSKSLNIEAHSKLFFDDDSSTAVQESTKLKGDRKWSKPILFRNSAAVHLLYDFLLNNQVKSFTNKKMHKCNRYLISDVPFHYASMDTLKQSGFSTVTRMAPASNEDDGKTNAPARHWQVQINGPITAFIAKRLITSNLSAPGGGHSVEVLLNPLLDTFQDPIHIGQQKGIVRRMLKSDKGYSIVFA